MADTLRILFLSHYALPHIGGIEATVETLSDGLRNKGHEVVHIASAIGASPPGQEAGGAIRLPAWNGLERRVGVPYPIFGPRLASEARSRVAWADVVHAHGFLYMPSVIGLHYARRLGPDRPARVLTEQVGHVRYTSKFLNRVEAAAIASLGRYAVGAAHEVLVVNERIESEVTALDPDAAVRLVPNAVDIELFRPADPAERAVLRRDLGWDRCPRILFVGRLVEKKGLDLAIASAQGASGAFRLVVAGPGHLPGSPPSVDLLGPQGPEQMRELYRAADAFLLPSHGEGLPVSMLEALASGLPVFLRDDPIYRDLASESNGAVNLLDPDPQAIVSVVSTFLADEGRRAAAAESARGLAQERFSSDALVDEHESIYRSLLE